MRLWLTVAAGLILDLGSKSLAWQALGGLPEEGGRNIIILPGLLHLIASKNPGIVFGFNPASYLGFPGTVLTVLLTLATCGLILYLFRAMRPDQRWMHLWCGLVLAGALGNLYDRLVYAGHVRDFIEVTASFTIAGKTLAWPYIFNVADVYLVVGVGALAAAYIFAGKPEKLKPRTTRSRAERKRGRA